MTNDHYKTTDSAREWLGPVPREHVDPRDEACEEIDRTHRLVSFHYTPTHASWVNLIEGFFSILTRQGLQQAVHQSAKELEHFLTTFVESTTNAVVPLI